MKDDLEPGDIVTFDFSRQTGYIYRGLDKEGLCVFEIFGGGARLITPPMWPEGDLKKIGTERRIQDALMKEKDAEISRLFAVMKAKDVEYYGLLGIAEKKDVRIKELEAEVKYIREGNRELAVANSGNMDICCAQRKELDALVSFILSECLHGELPDDIDKICVGFQQGEWYRKNVSERKK